MTKPTPGIPPIEPYPMPTEGDLPAGPVDWTPDPRRAVLLVHDMQRFFLRPFAGGTPGTELVANAALLRERCAAAGIPVAYTAQPGDMTVEQRGLLRDFWGPGMRTTPEDRQVIDELAPAPEDWVLTKWRYSAFARTDLLERVRAAGRDQLILCGVYAHIGVLMSTVDAFTNDIQPFLVADAVADFSAAYHRQALTYAAERCARVATTKQLLTELEDAR
ncbi:isochorismatase family protein [Kitasatospora cathayae]|uniref:Isochorismatase family protein n=1 Tax=Kitasatospora cathayae TaxID=3004092 RepID=A0ABY7Q0C4_9ACTN|nr:isochorismatase family protein [Kitasatospora sp. HUAS 3-15]WBP86140.1 isochorismatase family protein [Kitasatospora sp. HUAS 3-15]